jgi:hypothetical protein
MPSAELLRQIQLVLGAGFLVAIVVKAVEIARWIRRRPTAMLVWSAPKPPYYGLSLGIAVMMGLLILVRAYFLFQESATLSGDLATLGRSVFGELMMFTYFGYMLPLSTRIAHGLYADGIWTEGGFMPYDQIGGISLREGPPAVLIMISRKKMLSRRLQVPGQFLGEVRRLLRDKITSHVIEMDGGPGLHLGERDVRDSV